MADPNVLFFDIHRAAPFYPGTGSLEEVGVGLGDGTTVNILLPACLPACRCRYDEHPKEPSAPTVRKEVGFRAQRRLQPDIPVARRQVSAQGAGR